MEETIALIKSCIISQKGGIPIKHLNYEFEKIVGEPIPYIRLGFSSLQGLLDKVDGLKTIKRADGVETLLVNDPKIRHIVDLIQKQKENYKANKSKYYKRFTPFDSKNFNNITRNNDNPNNKIEYKDKNNVWFYDNAIYNKRRDVTTNGNQKLTAALYSYDSEDGNCNKYWLSTKRNNEYNNIVVIEACKTIKEKMIYEPIILSHQLIGDDFFLQLVIRYLGLPVWRQAGNMALHCGLCISGQTIIDCIKRLNEVECISNKIVIMLGAVDIYNGDTSYELIKNMRNLLKVLKYKFAFSNSAIKICTIPPLANLSSHGHVNKVSTLLSFNNWIRCLNCSENKSLQSNGKNVDDNHYQIIDLFQHFTDENYTTQYHWFQLNARMVSGCKHPYVLWNRNGRKRAMEALTAKL
ncbi:maternal effect protein oskar [Polistes fuscatus]|uniref:maternal effect protein oskar n=1 Tax=Polistes fuscatus TaxID=30207 RepID=UPI001CA8B9BB|nr:maternal effect protein oskar [Polistes fuscatus]